MKIYRSKENYSLQFANLPFERGEILFERR